MGKTFVDLVLDINTFMDEHSIGRDSLREITLPYSMCQAAGIPRGATIDGTTIKTGPKDPRPPMPRMTEAERKAHAQLCQMLAGNL